MVVHEREPGSIHPAGIGARTAGTADADHSPARDVSPLVKKDPLYPKMGPREIPVLDDERPIGSRTDRKGAASIDVGRGICGRHKIPKDRDVLMQEQVALRKPEPIGDSPQFRHGMWIMFTQERALRLDVTQVLCIDQPGGAGLLNPRVDGGTHLLCGNPGFGGLRNATFVGRTGKQNGTALNGIEVLHLCYPSMETLS